MENKIKQDTEPWVEERMALLAAPDDWEPDASLARTRLQRRMSSSFARRPAVVRIWLPRTAMIALACLVLIFAIPTTRALTRQLWQWLTVRNVEVVQADFKNLRESWLIPRVVVKDAEAKEDELPAPEEVTVTEAARRAGFIPRLPHEGVPTDSQHITTLDPMVWRTTVKVADLELSLRQAGVDDQPIPKEWDGAQLSMQVGSAIIASWPEGGIFLVQHQPVTLSAPPGFDFAQYWMAALRAAGVNREQAQRLAERMRTKPTMLIAFVAEHKVAIRDVSLRNGPATLIEEIGETGDVERVNLMWNVADRAYMLEAKSEEQAITVANSIE